VKKEATSPLTDFECGFCILNTTPSPAATVPGKAPPLKLENPLSNILSFASLSMGKDILFNVTSIA
jgi:hypothetical protein